MSATKDHDIVGMVNYFSYKKYPSLGALWILWMLCNRHFSNIVWENFFCPFCFLSILLLLFFLLDMISFSCRFLINIVQEESFLLPVLFVPLVIKTSSAELVITIWLYLYYIVLCCCTSIDSALFQDKIIVNGRVNTGTWHCNTVPNYSIFSSSWKVNILGLE